MNVALAAVVTKDLLVEYELFRASFRLYHNFDPVSVVHCDPRVYASVQSMPRTLAVPSVPVIDRPLSQRSEEFRSIVRHKMLATADAWRLLRPDAVAYIDADMVATAPFFSMFDDLLAPLTLSPHYWGGEPERRSRSYGFYNAGLILSRDRAFADWWLLAFESRPHLFADQECLSDACAEFDTSHFSERWNVGYWRRRSHDDVPAVGPDTLTLHAHMIVPARASNHFEVGQKKFVAEALRMLQLRDAPTDRKLLQAINGLAHNVVPGLITQDYLPPEREGFFSSALLTIL